MHINRRSFTAALAAAIAVVGLTRARAAEPLEALIHKDPNCGCCDAYARHLSDNGFMVHVVADQDMPALKVRFGVPANLASCHTVEIDGYVIEGHVPADQIRRLLKERPNARGLAVPGMPIGSPGMEGENPEPYDVVVFGADGQRVFARVDPRTR